MFSLVPLGIVDQLLLVGITSLVLWVPEGVRLLIRKRSVWRGATREKHS